MASEESAETKRLKSQVKRFPERAKSCAGPGGIFLSRAPWDSATARISPPGRNASKNALTETPGALFKTEFSAPFSATPARFGCLRTSRSHRPAGPTGTTTNTGREPGRVHNVHQQAAPARRTSDTRVSGPHQPSTPTAQDRGTDVRSRISAKPLPSRTLRCSFSSGMQGSTTLDDLGFAASPCQFPTDTPVLGIGQSTESNTKCCSAGPQIRLIVQVPD